MIEQSPFPSTTASAITRRQLLSYATLGAGTLLLPTAVNAANSELQSQIKQLITQQRRTGRISRNEHTAWSVYDLHARTKLVSINEDRRMQAASMVKVFVALAYFYLHKQAPRKYPYTSRQRYLMERMLVKSDNKATNAIMRLCKGPRNVQRLCQLATNNRFRQLHIIEYIPAGGRTYRNQASAHDYSRFLYDLWMNRLPFSQELKRIMSMSNKDRIATDTMPANTMIFDKTGSTGMLCGDMGVVRIGTNKAYTFIGIIQRSNRTKHYRSWIKTRSAAMRDVSDLVYNFMDKRYNILQSL